MLAYNSTSCHANAFVFFHRSMLTKDKKPADEKGKAKDTGEVIPQRPETPKLFKAALEVGTGEIFAKLKEAYKGATLEVFISPYDALGQKHILKTDKNSG